MLQRIFGQQSRTVAPTVQGGLAQGDHALNPANVLGIANGSITPMDAGTFRQVQTLPQQKEARYITAGEAAGLRTVAKQRRTDAKASQQGYQALASIARSDAKVQIAHRGYAAKAADATLASKAADAQLAAHLHGQRLSYAQLGQGVASAANVAGGNVAQFMALVRGA
jgi:hypothetical protein